MLFATGSVSMPKMLPRVQLRVHLCLTHLYTNASLKLKLQADHVDLTGCAEGSEFGHLPAHLIYGHLDGAQVCVVLIHHCYALFHIRETVCS